LHRLNVGADEPDPAGGFFVRSPGSRTITGVAHEYAKYLLDRRLAALAGEKAQLAALQSFTKEAAGFGITSVQIMGTLELARTAVAANLPLRLRIMEFTTTDLAAWREPLSTRVKGADRVTVSGTKWIVDGTPIERLMFLRTPYADKAQTKGALNFPPGQIAAFLGRALAEREQPLFHAVGDGAIDAVLDGLDASGGEAWQPLRPRIEHGDMVEPSHFDRIRKVGAIVVQNPAHFMLPQVMNARLGPRAAKVTMMKSMAAAGVPLALGSDGPLNPYLNLMFATINANNPAEAISREQAVAAYTLGSARAEFQDTGKGTISPGMLADVAMLSQDIFTAPVEALPKTVSVLTLVGGRVVHEGK
jgi:predicted amidohydrolase YtcJ